MSGVNISILEGGKAENFGKVTKLRTSNGTDHDLWVPKGDVETKHLSVKKNGLHYTNQYEPTASEKKDGKFHDIYGWDTITVSVKKKVTGKKKKINPSTGIEYDVPTSVDVDDDGNIIETELPVSIEIEVPPSKTEYLDGESISKAGMVVKAYYADDSEWGTVPLDETVIQPTTASGGEDEPYSASIDPSLLRFPNNNPLTFSSASGIIDMPSPNSEYGYRYNISGVDTVYVVHAISYSGSSISSHCLWWYSKSPFIIQRAWGNLGQEFPLRNTILSSTRVDEIVGEYEYTEAGTSQEQPPFPEWGHGDVSNNYSTEDFAKQIFGGVISGGGTAQTITVKWTPPEGEDELTDTFDITVIPHN